MPSERDYIELCKNAIEKHLVLNNVKSSLKSRDFEYLSGIIKEKSGILLSISTLKRIWNGSYSQIPQPVTLNALVSVLDYKDWHEFKQKNPLTRTRSVNIKFKILLSASIILLMLLFLFLFIFENQKTKEPVVKGKVKFTSDKTVSAGVPNTVVFKYDVSKVIADSFFIQQSWNSRNKVPIDPKNNVLSSIYYVPGFHQAKLIANNKIIASQNVHILSNGWVPYVIYDIADVIPSYFDFKRNLSNGHFSINKSELEKKGIDLHKDFKLRLNNSYEFGVSDDNFSVNTIFKCDSVKPAVCPRLEIMLVFDVQIFWIGLVKKGCEYLADYKIGEVSAKGSQSDLSALGCNVYEWQNLEINVHNRQAEVLLNGNSIIKTSYKQNFGKLVGIIYTFDNTGSVDFLSISDGEGKIVYADDFN
jgi:hypothetical protein